MFNLLNIILLIHLYLSYATAQDIGEAIVVLEVGDILELRNQSSQGDTIILAPLGSGSNPTVGQSTAAFSIFRIG